MFVHIKNIWYYNVYIHPTFSTVFNLQASDWVHCKEKTGAYYQLSRFTYKLVIFLLIFKVGYLPINAHF